jgi:hypothetical protein
MSSPDEAHQPGPELGLRYETRVMDGGLTLGVAMTHIPGQATPETLAKLLIDDLKRKNITYGVDEAAVLRLMQSRTLGELVEIGHGTPPRPGKDAEIQMLILPPSFMAAADEKGQVDYKNIENVSEVKAGDVIARKIPSDPGEPGFNMFGKEVRPAPVRDAKLPAGKNTTISADGLELLAAKDGFLRWREDKVEVAELYLVMGDVGLKTGNIHYQSEVEIHGNVQAGFEVVAGGDVRIFGSVDGGKVISQNGSVSVWQGVMGSAEGPAIISALGDVQIGRARFATIESKAGSVTANNAVEHCEIRAAGNLTLHSGPALNSVVEVGGKVDIMAISHERERPAGIQQDVRTSGAGNRRRYVRVVASPPIAVDVMPDDSDQTIRGEIIDLSAGGIKLRVEGRLKEGARFQTQFKVPGVEGTMWMDAVVVRTVDPADAEQPDTHRSYGVEFTHIEPAVREALAKYCLAEDLRQHKLARSGAPSA